MLETVTSKKLGQRRVGGGEIESLKPISMGKIKATWELCNPTHSRLNPCAIPFRPTVNPAIQRLPLEPKIKGPELVPIIREDEENSSDNSSSPAGSFSQSVWSSATEKSESLTTSQLDETSPPTPPIDPLPQKKHREVEIGKPRDIRCVYGKVRNKNCRCWACRKFQSFGVVAYRVVPKHEKGQEDSTKREYLFLKRRTSIGFIEIMFARYSLDNLEYLQTLVHDMSDQEQEALLTKSYQELYEHAIGHELTGIPPDFPYEKAKDLFEKMKEGVQFKRMIVDRAAESPVSAPSTQNSSDDPDQDHAVVKDEAEEEYPEEELTRSKTSWKWNWKRLVSWSRKQNPDNIVKDTTYGFPKGKMFRWESQMQCALREFMEETDIDINSVLSVHKRPFIEQYTGLDGQKYLYTYFVAQLKPESKWSILPPLGRNEKNVEVGSLNWLSLAESQSVLEKIPSRMQVLKAIDKFLNRESNASLAENSYDCEELTRMMQCSQAQQRYHEREQEDRKRYGVKQIIEHQHNSQPHQDHNSVRPQYRTSYSYHYKNHFNKNNSYQKRFYNQQRHHNPPLPVAPRRIDRYARPHAVSIVE